MSTAPGPEVGVYTASIALPPVVRSVPVARRVLTELLGAWAADQYSEEAGLLVSELVTNVVRHVEGTASLVVEIRLVAPLLRVSVLDSSRFHPVARQPEATGPGGHGMWLVDAIADRWGSDEHVDGKQVWFELRDGRATG